MDIRIICYALSLLLLSTPAISSEIKRWIGEDGSVHFGDTPPHSTDTTLITPAVITTKPASNNTLQNSLRPGERRMLQQYEQRGRRLEKGKRESVRNHKKREQKIAQMEKKCHYHRQKMDDLKRKLRSGYIPSRKASILQGIDRHRSSIRRYCNH
ncbi:MAG: DUF4124 domain-containing protein [Gammaproteobacteria bacterium]|nr:DUF4124 domain-containing protein [Gammaproteobacteria bacterium]